MSGKILPPTGASKGEILARFAVSSVVGFAAALWTAMINRRAVMRLSELDDRLLRDIGLTRNDVRSSLAEPWHVDPSQRLSLRRLERKSNRNTARSRMTEAGRAVERAVFRATQKARLDATLTAT